MDESVCFMVVNLDKVTPKARGFLCMILHYWRHLCHTLIKSKKGLTLFSFISLYSCSCSSSLVLKRKTNLIFNLPLPCFLGPLNWDIWSVGANYGFLSSLVKIFDASQLV
ncbi:hypothetical protein RJT34_14007 [Clitoria ternatea]|uniref:Uncharacterized protein n=1 Tax=Clitoria ternatea TaxID=43366 RepID=A0AAN9JS45_CLITE